MDDDAPHRLRWPRVLARVAAFTLLAVLLYLLSAGPAVYFFVGRSKSMDRTLELIFSPGAPLVMATGLGPAVDLYLTWWIELPGGPEERLLRKSTPLPASQDLPLDAPIP